MESPACVIMWDAGESSAKTKSVEIGRCFCQLFPRWRSYQAHDHILPLYKYSGTFPYTFKRNDKKTAVELLCWFEFLCWISRYLTASLHSLTLAPPLRSGNAGLFTLLAHGSGVWWWEGPSAEAVWKHVHIPTGPTAQALSPSTLCSAQAAVPRKKRRPLSRFSERPWRERESQNKDNRHNHQKKLANWRRNSLATDSHFLVRTETPLADSKLVKVCCTVDGYRATCKVFWPSMLTLFEMDSLTKLTNNHHL